ncbi:MAG: glycosyltransferase, partial [Rhodospirillales bacterium]|nr:glycosyltransferase [Rhodospirillales bacterium]
VLARLVEGMDRARFRNLVVSMSPPGAMAPRIAAADVPIHSLGMGHGLPSPAAVSHLVEVLNKERPAVLQTWLYHADLLGLVAGRLAGVPRILWNIRDAEPAQGHSRLTRPLPHLLARLSALPDGIVINSSRGQAVHEGYGYHPRRWHLIRNGFDTTRLKPDLYARPALRAMLGVSEATVLVGLVARRDPVKDHEGFLHAAALVPREDVHFVLIGRGTEFLAARAVQLGLEDRIHLLGERQDVGTLLPGLDVAVNASTGEGLANAIGEAMACAVPCIVTDVGDSAFMVGGSGRVVPPSDPKALAAAMGEMTALPPTVRRTLGEAARKRITEHFSLKTFTAAYETLYAELSQERAG